MTSSGTTLKRTMMVVLLKRGGQVKQPLMLASLFSPLHCLFLCFPLFFSVPSLSWKRYYQIFLSVLLSNTTFVLLFPFDWIVSSKFLCLSPWEFHRRCIAIWMLSTLSSVSDTCVLGLFTFWFSLSLWLIPRASWILTLQEAFPCLSLFSPNWFFLR